MWKTVKLGEVCDLQNGFAFKSSLFREEGLPILRISNIQNEEVSLEKLAYFVEEDYDISFERYKVLPNDLLIAMSGATTGKLGFNQSGQTLYLNQRVGKFEPKGGLDKKYLYYVLSTKVEENLSISKGAAQPNLSTQQIKDIAFPLPPIAEQQRIVAKLDAAFAEIDRAVELSNEKAKQAARLVQNAIREKTLSIMQQHGSKQLAELCDLQNGFAFKSTKFRDSGTPVLRISNIQDGSITTEKLVYASQDDYAENLDKYIVTKDALLIAMSGATTGKVGIQKSEQDFYLNQRVGMLKPKANLDRDFLYFFLSTKVEELLSISAGAAQPNLSTKQIKEIQLPNATLREQRDFSSALSRLSAEIDSLLSLSERTLNNLAALKSAILAQELQPPQSEAA
jgi:type I restriction enzyme S subunit